MSNKAVITCALNGVLTDPKQHNVPVTPEQMAREAKAAFDAGASIMHIHLRQQAPNQRALLAVAGYDDLAGGASPKSRGQGVEAEPVLLHVRPVTLVTARREDRPNLRRKITRPCRERRRPAGWKRGRPVRFAQGRLDRSCASQFTGGFGGGGREVSPIDPGANLVDLSRGQRVRAQRHSRQIVKTEQALYQKAVFAVTRNDGLPRNSASENGSLRVEAKPRLGFVGAMTRSARGLKDGQNVAIEIGCMGGRHHARLACLGSGAP